MVTAIGAGSFSGIHFILLSFLRTRCRLGITLSSFHFNEIVDLVLEPGDRVLADIDMQGKFSGRLKPGEMHARPGDAALFEGLVIEEPSAGLSGR